MALSSGGMSIAGYTIEHLSKAVGTVEGGRFLTDLKEQQMCDAAKAVLDRAFDELMVMFQHVDKPEVLLRDVPPTIPF